MFQNLAKRDAGRRHMVPQAVSLHSNDNRLDRCVAAVTARPQRLACHWRAGADGRLECHWQIEPAQVMSAEAVPPELHDRTPLGAALPGKSFFRLANP
jgi:hypothetical protein